MDEFIIVIILIVVSYLWDFIVKKLRAGEATAEDEVSLADEYVACEALVSRVEEQSEGLAATRAWRNAVGAIYTKVLMPKAYGLVQYVQMAQAAGNTSVGWSIHHRRLTLTRLADALEGYCLASEMGSTASTYVGSELYATLDELRSEVGGLFPVYPNPDVVLAVDLPREALEHLYAAWGPAIFADVATAILDRETAEVFLARIESDQNALYAPYGQPPSYVRGQVIARAMGQDFRGSQGTGDLYVTASTGERFVLPAELVVEDVLAHARRMVRRRWSALENCTLRAIAAPVGAAGAAVAAERVIPPKPAAEPTVAPARQPTPREEPRPKTDAYAQRAETRAAARVRHGNEERETSRRTRAQHSEEDPLLRKKRMHAEAFEAARRRDRPAPKGARRARSRGDRRAVIRDAVILSETLQI